MRTARWREKITTLSTGDTAANKRDVFRDHTVIYLSERGGGGGSRITEHVTGDNTAEWPEWGSGISMPRVNASAATHDLCAPGHVTQPLWASMYSPLQQGEEQHLGLRGTKIKWVHLLNHTEQYLARSPRLITGWATMNINDILTELTWEGALQRACRQTTTADEESPLWPSETWRAAFSLRVWKVLPSRGQRSWPLQACWSTDKDESR